MASKTITFEKTEPRTLGDQDQDLSITTTGPSCDGTSINFEENDDHEASQDQSSRFSSHLHSASQPGSSIGYSQDSDLSSFSDSVGSFSSGAIAGSGTFDECSLDSIGRVLIQLEDNAASLTKLVIDCKSIDKEAAAEVGQYLPNNTRLKKLHLLCGNRSRYRDIFRRVVSGLKENKSIEYIEIEGASMNHETASWLVPSLTHSKTLKHLSMVSCRGSGLEDVFVAMQRNEYIQQLTFQLCYWEDQNADIMAFSLPIMNLTSLSLVDINIPTNGWPYLLKNIKNCKQLTQLDLSWNGMDSKIICLLAKNLKVQRQISKLCLQSCCLDDECMKEVSRGFRNYFTLTSLDISQNELTNKGVVYLKALLLFNNSITELNVGGCGLNEQSLHTIDSGLNYNQSCLKNFVSFSVFDFVDSMFTPHTQKKKKNGSQTAIQPAKKGTPLILDERDAIETNARTLAEEERSRVDDEMISFLNDGAGKNNPTFSAATEACRVKTARTSRKGKSPPINVYSNDNTDHSIVTEVRTVRTARTSRKGKGRGTTSSRGKRGMLRP